MTAAALVRTALAVVLTAGLVTGCGDDDNPIPSAGTDRPIGTTPESSQSPSAAGTPAPGASADPSATPTPAPAATGTVVSGNGFTVLLPGQPEQSRVNGPAGSRITFDIYRYEAGPEVYTVSRGHYPKLGTLPFLKEAIDSAADQAGGKLATSRTFKFRKMSAIEGTITGVKDKGEEVTIFARYVVVGRVMFGLLFLDRAGSTAPTLPFRTFAESLTFSG